MKSVILFETKTGTSRKCVEIIQNNNNISEVYKVSSFTGDLKNYKNIILVSPIYMGQINKQIVKHIQSGNQNMQLVLVGTNTKPYNETIHNTFDKSTLERIKITHVGGAYNFDKLNFLQKFIIKKMTGISETTDLLKYDVLKSITC